MREIDPMGTSRAYAFEMWMNAPMPMVTFFRTLDVSALVKAGKKKRLEIQYAYVLVYRNCFLFFCCRILNLISIFVMATVINQTVTVNRYNHERSKRNEIF